MRQKEGLHVCMLTLGYFACSLISDLNDGTATLTMFPAMPNINIIVPDIL